MREPRPSLPWSRDRVVRRHLYETWMASRAWLGLRAKWGGNFVAVFGIEPTCAACKGPWTLQNGDLHHRHYDRLGHEHFKDLVPLCRTCHDRVHRILESTPAWGRMSRAQASDVIVGRLRARASGKRDR
jgi:5-methylcytosine-specific restriction endonuclease McrA